MQHPRHILLGSQAAPPLPLPVLIDSAARLQRRPILEAFAPEAREIGLATKISQAHCGPITFDGKLHDCVGYRYLWQVLERAHQTGQCLPFEAQVYFFGYCSDQRH